MTTPIPEPYRDYVTGLVDAARDTLEKHGELSPLFVIGSIERRFVAPIAGLLKLPPPIAMLVAKNIADKEQADFVLVSTEVWAKTSLSEAELRERRAQYECVADMPDRESAVYFRLETYHGVWAAVVPRLGTEGHYTFGEVEFDLLESSSGPFSDMLPRRASDTLQ
jgi:hypothetical protein